MEVVKTQGVLSGITYLKVNTYILYVNLENTVAGIIVKEVMQESVELALEGEVDILGIIYSTAEVIYGLSGSEKEISALRKGNTSTQGVSNPRKISGVATGGENLSNPIKSMRGSNGNIGLVPKEVADNLRGREFNSFDDFRNAFWQEYSTSSYASEFSKANIKRMSQGLAPKAPASQQYKNISSYVLHHKNPIYNGGGVYDLDNIIISSPRMHQEILDKGFHFNK